MFNNYIAHQTTEVGGKNHQLKSADENCRLDLYWKNHHNPRPTINQWAKWKKNKLRDAFVGKIRSLDLWIIH